MNYEQDTYVMMRMSYSGGDRAVGDAGRSPEGWAPRTVPVWGALYSSGRRRCGCGYRSLCTDSRRRARAGRLSDLRESRSFRPYNPSHLQCHWEATKRAALPTCPVQMPTCNLLCFALHCQFPLAGSPEHSP